MDQRIVGGPRIARAERILSAIDQLMDELCEKEPTLDAVDQILAMKEAAHTASFAIASVVWAYQGSSARAREIEKRALSAYHALAGGVGLKEKQFAVLSTLEIAARQNRLELQSPADVLAFFCERVGPAFPKTLLRSLTFEDLEPAVIAAGRKPGRRRGAKTGSRQKPKSEILNEFLKKLRVEAATGAALEKARERKPIMPQLPD